MNSSEEWKSFFPVGDVFGAPLLLSSPDILGPLCFNPNPNSLTCLFDSHSDLSPPILNPPSQLSISRFLQTHDSYIPLSAVSDISFKYSGCDEQDSASFWLSRNRIQLLHAQNSVFVFFPTGSNFDQIGFLVLEADGGGGLKAVGSSLGGVFSANKCLNQRVRGILVNPASDSSWLTGESSSDDDDAIIGHLLAYCMYSVHWFCVRNDGGTSEKKKKPSLVCMGSRSFKSSAVVSACWSPHLLEECIVLLEDGSLFLFNLDSSSPSYSSSLCFGGTLLKVSWDDESKKSFKWLGCEFSWHPRTLIVARSDAAFLVDWQFDDHKVTCLAKLDMFGPYGRTRFQAFSKAVSSNFHFILVSSSSLVLCDVRRPLSPLLIWTHGLDRPCYVDTFRLSDLRSNLKDDTQEWANKSGFAIILGSFLNSEFSIFCYGPPLPGPYKSVGSKISQLSKSVYAWGLPSYLNLQNADCVCGSCLVREEFAKDTLPEWLDWNQKRDLVLGFGILSGDMYGFSTGEFDGFGLIRLMSSGKLELQQYSASWELFRTLGDHTDRPLLSGGNNLYTALEDEKYKFPRKFKYLDLDYLSAYLNGDLSRILDLKLRNSCTSPMEEGQSFGLDIHEALCEKLKSSGLNRFRASPINNLVLKDVNLPASIQDIALSKIWAGLPMELLQLAFSSYSELLEVQLDQKEIALEFSAVPDLPQLPPFPLKMPSHRSNKWSNSVQRSGDTLVGPVLPLPVLITLHELRNGSQNSEEEATEFSAEAEIDMQCNEVMEMAKEVALGGDLMMAKFGDDETAVSLASQKDAILVDSEQPKSFLMYHPAALQGRGGNGNNSYSRDESASTFITRLESKEASTDDKQQDPTRPIFKGLCPIDLKFPDDLEEFHSKEHLAYKMLKRVVVKWQEQLKPYQDFLNIPSNA